MGCIDGRWAEGGDPVAAVMQEPDGVVTPAVHLLQFGGCPLVVGVRVVQAGICSVQFIFQASGFRQLSAQLVLGGESGDSGAERPQLGA